MATQEAQPARHITKSIRSRRNDTVTEQMELAETGKSRKILMIAPQPFLEARGTPISVYQRLWGLSSLGHQVDLLTYHIGQDVQLDGVRIERIAAIPFIKHVKIGPSFAKLILDVFIFLKAFRLLLTRKYDVVHSHEEGAFIANLLAPLFGVKHVYDMHSSLPQQLDNYDFGNNRLFIWLFRKFECWTLRTCDALITVGADLADYATQINPAVPHALIENLPIQTLNGHHTDAIDALSAELREDLQLQEKQVVVYTGNFEQYQGIDLLVNSAEIVIDKHPETVFILVGGKPNQVAHWQQEVKKRNMNGSVRFVGTVPLTDAHSYSSIADILVSPRTDGLSVPLKLYTYLYTGKPIVATKIPAHTLILDDDNAMLVESNAIEMAAGISRLIEDPDLQQRLGAAAARLSQEKYSSENYLHQLEKLYDAVTPRVSTVSTD
jgi:glycosyltransferase involved in cell wall biosynthesis